VNALAPPRLLNAAATSDVTVEIARGIAAFEQLQPEWDQLFTRAAAPHQIFQNHAFLRAWAHAYAGDGGGLTVIAARADGRLVAILPLVRRRRFGIEVLQFMGSPMAQFDDLLLDDAYAQSALAAVSAAVVGLDADLLEARRVREDGAFWRLPGHQAIIFEKMEAPFADLALRVADGQPGQAYSSRDRSNYRRRMRRLGERGKLRLHSIGPCDEAGGLAVQAIAMKAATLRRNGVDWGTVGCARFSDFFRRLAVDPASGLLVSIIELDGRPVGIDLSFLCKEVGFGHVLATDGEFDKEGLGQMLVHHVFAQAKAAGASRFDLLAPADPYKRHHADGATGVESRVYAFTAKGRLAAQLGYRLLMPAARKLPRSIIRRLRGE
jgi:CelD/BcsL family acetyltransferase involved in cellulose biosynthesis